MPRAGYRCPAPRSTSTARAKPGLAAKWGMSHGSGRAERSPSLTPHPHMENAAAAGIRAPFEWTLNAFSARAARLKAPVYGAFAFNPSEQQLRSKRASSRSRQQRRPGPQGAQEKDAARGHFPRDEAPRSLRKAIRKKSARKGRRDPP